MLHRQRLCAICVFFLITASTFLTAQSPRVLERDFAEAAALFQEGDFALAESRFGDILRRTESRADEPHRTYALYSYLWRGLSRLRQSEFQGAVADLTIATERAADTRTTDVYLSAAASLGEALLSLSRYDEAEQILQAGLAHAESTKGSAYFAAFHRALGNVQYGWGKYDEALQFYEVALGYAEQRDSVDDVVTILDAIGRVHLAWFDFDAAIPHFERAIEIGAASDYVVSAIDGLGISYLYSEQYEQALTMFSRSAIRAESTGNSIALARSLVHSGAAYQQLGRFTEATERYAAALEINERLSRDVDAAVCLTNLGYVALLEGRYAAADDYLSRSIEIKDRLRATATGFDRVTYLESELKTYALIAEARVLAGGDADAFAATDYASATYLREQIGGDLESDLSGNALLRAVQRELGPDTLLLRYAVLPGNRLALFAITRDNITTHTLNPENPDAIAEYVDLSAAAEGGTRGLVPQTESVTIATTPTAEFGTSFTEAVRRFHALLQQPAGTISVRRERDELSRFLADQLLAPVIDDIGNARRVVVIPAGILSAIPFESLRMPDDRYLIQHVDLSYAYSASIALAVARRRYDHERIPMLALGGAEYSRAEWRVNAPTSTPVRSREFVDAAAAADTNGDIRGLLSGLGIVRWDDLPGTNAEIARIRELYPDGEFYVGARARETTIRDLAQRGRLRDYATIHIAAHGFVVEEFPSLSSIVLGQDLQNATDGYLTVREIADLDLAADFVNLSACETGLGRLYLGEGVVGLAHAFVTAGANNLMVSLWQVADQSTSQYMSSLYQLVVADGRDYAAAAATAKRLMLDDERYSDPFYWAPFVVYGTL